jgi:hypothetical protein
MAQKDVSDEICGFQVDSGKCKLGFNSNTQYCEYNTNTNKCVFKINPDTNTLYTSDIVRELISTAKRGTIGVPLLPEPLVSSSVRVSLKSYPIDEPLPKYKAKISLLPESVNNKSNSHFTEKNGSLSKLSNQPKFRPLNNKKIGDVVDNLKCLNHDTVISTTGRIVAIGDIHGDFEALVYALYAAALIDDDGNWIGCNTILVQTGDIFDDKRVGVDIFNRSSPPTNIELHILEYLTNLNEQAVRQHGKIILCLGNHEWMAVNGTGTNYVSDTTHTFYDNDRLRWLSPGSPLALKLACIYKIGVLVNDYLFCHGGFNIYNIKSIVSLSGLNIVLSKYFKGELRYGILSVFTRHLNDPDGILWDRSSSINFHEPVDGNVCKNFKDLRDRLQLPKLKLIVGHTTWPIINATCNYGEGNTIYRIDTSMSRAFGNKTNLTERINVLDIISDTEIAAIEVLKDHNYRYSILYKDYSKIIPDVDEYFSNVYKVQRRFDKANPTS